MRKALFIMLAINNYLHYVIEKKGGYLYGTKNQPTS
jgi:hypothetical protein